MYQIYPNFPMKMNFLAKRGLIEPHEFLLNLPLDLTCKYAMGEKQEQYVISEEAK